MEVFYDNKNKVTKHNHIVNIKRIVNAKQIFIINTVGLCFLVNSMVMGFSAPALPLLREDKDIKLTEEEGSWIASIVPFGAIFGALIASYILDWIGSRNLLYFSMMSFMASWVLIAKTNNVMLMIFARLLSGVCVGLSSSSGSVFLAETVQQDFRTSQGIIMGIYGTFGIFFMSILGTFESWRGLAWIGVAMCAPPLLCMQFLPESPYFLYNYSSLKSLQSLEWLLEEENETRKQFKEMKYALKLSKEQTDNCSMFTKTNAFPTLNLFALHIFQQLTGINILIFYSTLIFSKIVGEEKAELYAILMTVLNVFSCFISSFYQGYSQRRYLLKLSTSIVVPCLCTLSAYFALQSSYVLTLRDFDSKITLIPIAAIYIFIISFALGWGPVPFLFMGEGLPSTIRGNATGKAMALNWASAFIITKTYAILSASIGHGWLFLLYSFCTAIGGFAIYIYMPETFGKTLNEMDMYYNKIKSTK